MDTGKIRFSKSSLFPASLPRETVFGLNKMATLFLKKFKFLTWDKLQPKDMKKLINIFVELLLVISEESWKVGKRLNDWKQGNVIIIFKIDSENYRPDQRSTNF